LLLLLLVGGGGVARSAPLDAIAPDLFFVNNLTRDSSYYTDGDAACARIADDLNRPRFQFLYSNPKYAVNPPFGTGCFFDVTALQPPFQTYRSYSQNWVLPSPVCPGGYIGPFRPYINPGNYWENNYCLRSGPSPSKGHCCTTGNPVLPNLGIKTERQADYGAPFSLLDYTRIYRYART
jgi:hypothetical protein